MSEDFYAIAKRVSNWGRWGKEDQRGALNLVTPDVLRRAGAAARQGKLFRLGLDFADDGLQARPGGPTGRFNPRHTMTVIGESFGGRHAAFGRSDDIIEMPLQSSTQWDGLAHVQYDGRLYNGFAASDVLSAHGAAKVGMEHAASPGIMSHAVLLDIARLKGVDRLDGQVSITPDDLEAACRAQKVSVERGDILLVRTGHMGWFMKDRNFAKYYGPQPGLSMECALWLRERDVVALCVDNTAVERWFPGMMGVVEIPIPLHNLCIRDMGLYFGELFYFDDFADDCAADGVYTCLFSAPVLPIRGAVGAPINPLALK